MMECTQCGYACTWCLSITDNRLLCAVCERIAATPKPKPNQKHEPKRRVYDVIRDAMLQRQCCLDCKLAVDDRLVYAFAFKHRQSEEQMFAVNLRMHTKETNEIILTEINKCDLRCRNCWCLFELTPHKQALKRKALVTKAVVATDCKTLLESKTAKSVEAAKVAGPMHHAKQTEFAMERLSLKRKTHTALRTSSNEELDEMHEWYEWVRVYNVSG